MNGWRVMLGGTIAAFGVMAFLTVVAHEIQRLETQLEQREHAARKAQQKRQMLAAATRPVQARGHRPEEDAA